MDRLRASLATKENKRNAIEERLKSTKPLEDLKERENELQRQNEEDQVIIQDENTLPSDRHAAERTQVEERERALPL